MVSKWIKGGKAAWSALTGGAKTSSKSSGSSIISKFEKSPPAESAGKFLKGGPRVSPTITSVKPAKDLTKKRASQDKKYKR